MIELRSLPEWPRYREGARKDELDWIKSLDDRELARLAAGLGQVERAVRRFREVERPRYEFRLPRDLEPRDAAG